MEYKGKLYAKIGGRYIECTESVEDLENKIKILEQEVKQLQVNLKLSNQSETNEPHYDKCEKCGGRMKQIDRNTHQCNDCYNTWNNF